MAVTLISSLDKKKAHDKKMVTIGINGTNLDLVGDKSCTLTRRDTTRSSKTVTAHSLTVVSSSKALVAFNLRGCTHGIYDLNYVIDGTTTTLARGFRI